MPFGLFYLWVVKNQQLTPLEYLFPVYLYRVIEDAS